MALVSYLAILKHWTWRLKLAWRKGMGIKAVSTPILAGETAVGFWRGSAILAWQLWYVAAPF